MNYSDIDFLSFVSKPRVAASFYEKTDVDVLNKLKDDGLEIAEIRVDMSGLYDYKSISELMNNYEQFYRILTIRSAIEGGQWRHNDRVRYDLFFKLMHLCDAVDIELDSLIYSQVMNIAKESKKNVIVSHHDFSETKDIHYLNEYANSAFNSGADIFKIATSVRDDSEFNSLQNFLTKWNDRKIIVIGMGSNSIAKKTRILFPSKGSCIAFSGFKKNLYGQFSIKETVELIKNSETMKG